MGPFCASCLAATGSALALAACGASQTHAASRGNAGRSRVSATAEGANSGGCRTVARPIPKGPQHIAKPTLKLDPAKRYVVQLTTNCGKIDVQLDVRSAPAIAASFVYLVRMGFYNDLTFHRVVANFVIQGGDPNGDGSGGPGYTVIERPPASLRYTKGTVAMAKAATDPAGAAGSQFFIVTGSHVELPPQYALLGKVVGGQSTLSAISHVPTTAGSDGEDSSPKIPIVISKATVEVS